MTILIGLAGLWSTTFAQSQAELDAAAASTKKLGDSLVGVLGSSFSYSLPFLASAGNYAPLEYGKLIPLIDFYVSGPIMIAGGKVDPKALSDMNDALKALPGGGGTDLKKITDTIGQLPFFPAPPLLVGAARGRLQLPIPIVKDLELTVKVGGIPGDLAKPLISPLLPPGMTLDVNAFLFGVGARYRLVNLKVFQLGVAGAFNNLSGRFNVGFGLGSSQAVATSGTNGTIEQKISFNIKNDYNFSTINLDLIANLNLLIFQLYGGAGLGVNFGAGGSSSYTINGDTVLKVAGTSSNLAPLSVSGSYPYRTELVPKLALGFRLFILDVSGEVSIPFNAVALRAALAFSF